MNGFEQDIYIIVLNQINIIYSTQKMGLKYVCVNFCVAYLFFIYPENSQDFFSKI